MDLFIKFELAIARNLNTLFGLVQSLTSISSPAVYCVFFRLYKNLLTITNRNRNCVNAYRITNNVCFHLFFTHFFLSLFSIIFRVQEVQKIFVYISVLVLIYKLTSIGVICLNLFSPTKKLLKFGLLIVFSLFT